VVDEYPDQSPTVLFMSKRKEWVSTSYPKDGIRYREYYMLFWSDNRVTWMDSMDEIMEDTDG
jgi:hypothetical protein